MPLASEDLWGTMQGCTAGPIVDPANSVDLVFNDLVAVCGPFGDGDSWTYTGVQDTYFATIALVTLDVRFYITGFSNDEIDLEVHNGYGWQGVASYSANSPPPLTLMTLSFPVSGIFINPAEVNAAQIRFVVRARGQADLVGIYLDEARLVVHDEIPTPTPLPPLPTPTPAAPAPTNVPGAGDPHVEYDATTASCAGCHRAHTGEGIVLRQAWPEEGSCFACHSIDGPGSNVEPAFANYENSETRFFKHDIAATSGVHRMGEMSGADFGGENRHVECEDCHEPHEATRGESPAPMLQREMSEVSGVDPVWTSPGAPSSFTWLASAEREYQICFKCHSSFTLPSSYVPDGWDGAGYVVDGLRKLTYVSPQQVPDSRDMASEFNPFNASYHPVVTLGRNQSMPADSFVPGWSSSSMVYCTDCHANPYPTQEGLGPHGSPLLHLLTGYSEYQTAASDYPAYAGTEVCFTCHDQEDYIGNGRDTNFRRSGRNLHVSHRDNATCYLCHDTHGSEQLHLINLDLSIENGSNSYLLPGYDGQPTNSQTFWQISPDRAEKTCWLVCHDHDHVNSSYANIGD